MALSDEMAKLVMGEIDDTVKQIEGLSARVETSKNQLSEIEAALTKSSDLIARTAQAAEAASKKYITDLISAGMVELEKKTAAQVEVFSQAAELRSEADTQAMLQVAQDARAAALKGLADEAAKIVSNRVAVETTNLNAASARFEEAGEAIAQINRAAGQAVKKLDAGMQEAIEKNQPNLFVNLLLNVLCGSVAAGVIFVLAVYGKIPMPAAQISQAQATQMQEGAMLEKIWPKLTKKEQEAITAKWK